MVLLYFTYLFLSMYFLFMSQADARARIKNFFAQEFLQRMYDYLRNTNIVRMVTNDGV